MFRKKTIEEDIRLEWRIFLARQNPARAISVLILILVCSWFVLAGTQDLLLAGASFAILMLAVSSYYVPVRFVFTDTRIYRLTFFSRQSRLWEAFHSHQISGSYIRLSTMSKPSRLDNYRGLLLICPGSRKDEILDFVRKKINENENKPLKKEENDR